MTPELILLAIVISFLLISYLIVYPLFVRSDIKRLLTNDIIASTLALAVAGRLYWGTGVEFSFLGLEMNWFLFTLSCYMLLEFPLFKLYSKRYNISLTEHVNETINRDD